MKFIKNNISIGERKADRPIIRPAPEPVDWLIEALALIGLSSFSGFIVYIYPRLPAIVPTHFNEVGIADDYGSKSFLLILPAIALFIYILLTLLSFVPYLFNYPSKITLQNARRQYTLATRLVRFLKMIIILLFFIICYMTTRVAFHEASGLGPWFMPIFLILVFAPIVIYMIAALRKK